MDEKSTGDRRWMASANGIKDQLVQDVFCSLSTGAGFFVHQYYVHPQYWCRILSMLDVELKSSCDVCDALLLS